MIRNEIVNIFTCQFQKGHHEQFSHWLFLLQEQLERSMIAYFRHVHTVTDIYRKCTDQLMKRQATYM